MILVKKWPKRVLRRFRSYVITMSYESCLARGFCWWCSWRWCCYFCGGCSLSRWLSRTRLMVVPIIVIVIVIVIAVVISSALIVISLLAVCWVVCLRECWSVFTFVVMKDGQMGACACPASGPWTWAELGDVFRAQTSEAQIHIHNFTDSRISCHFKEC